MTTVDQFLKALALTESDDNPEAWGDAGRAMGRWQVHPDRLWTETHARGIAPSLGETWDQLVARTLRAMYAELIGKCTPDELAMFWHLGHSALPGAGDWDTKYEVRFTGALASVIAEIP